MNSRIRRLVASTALILSLAAVPISPAPAAQTAYSSADHLPSITLIDQGGRHLTLASLRGRPVLVGFIHTMCKGPCEMLTARMRSVAADLKPHYGADVAMVQITTDPADDDPAQLLKYSREQGVDRTGWIFLTGSPGDIKRVMTIYGVSHQETDDAMMHVMKLFLVAPDGRLVKTYSPMETSPQRIASDIEMLARDYAHSGAVMGSHHRPDGQ